MSSRYDEIPLQRLRLDGQNPRLRHDLPADARTPERLLEYFVANYNLMELALSMADKGFEPKQVEALLVVEEPAGSQAYVVVEGNRRLATAILLTDTSKRHELSLPAIWDNLAAEAASEGHEFDPLPVLIYDSRTELDDYLAFRHLTGPLPWRPEAKARFVVHLLEGGAEVAEVAKRVGTNARTVRRYAEAYVVFEQASNSGINVQPVEAGFGIFYNALNTPGVRSFLGLGPAIEVRTRPINPVPEERIDHLEQLISLLFGDEDTKLKKVIAESRELAKLSMVLEKGPATALLIENRDLEQAYLAAGGGKQEIIVSLYDSWTKLVQANGQIFAFKTDDEVRSLVERIRALVENMSMQIDDNTQDV